MKIELLIVGLVESAECDISGKTGESVLLDANGKQLTVSVRNLPQYLKFVFWAIQSSPKTVRDKPAA